MSTSPEQKFDPALAQSAAPQRPAGRAQRVYDERVFVNVEKYALSRDGGQEWAIGRLVTNPDEKVKVRLSTVEERLADSPDRFTEARLRQQYEGENKRESMGDKAKGKIQYIAFDGARPLGVDEDGVKQYRAHWPETMAANPRAEVASGLGSIHLYDPPEGSPGKAEAYVEFLRSATIVDGSNAKEAFESALSIKDDEGNARAPHAIVRVFYNGDEVAVARAFPAREEAMVTDPNYGDEKKVRVPVEGDASYNALIGGEPTGIDFIDGSNDLARAVIAGLRGDDEVPRANVMSQESVANFFHGAKNGDLTVEIVAAERIGFGSDSAKTYLRNRENPKFSSYFVTSEGDDGRLKKERGYGNTVVALQRYDNGQPYAIYASPQENWPQVSPLSKFDQNMPLTAILPEDPKAPRQEKSNDNEMSM